MTAEAERRRNGDDYFLGTEWDSVTEIVVS